MHVSNINEHVLLHFHTPGFMQTIFDKFPGVWNCGQPWSLVFEISLQTR